MSDSPILELRGINKSFGAVQVLHDVNFRVLPGEVMALVGDNGAGKSTLVKCISGIYSIDSGEIVDNSLFAADLAPNSVGSSEIAADAVGTSEVADNSLTVADIKGASINGSVSLSGIPNGRCVTVIFNVGGAAVGEVPLVAIGAAIQQGIIMYGQRVVSTGQVEVAVCNLSGGAMTPLSHFPVHVITIG